MIKDLSQTMYYCSIVNAMNESSLESREYHMSMYAPETNIRYNRKYNEPWIDDISYGKYGNNYSSNHGDLREGKSHISRKIYMELKENDPNPAHQAKELEKYIMELGEDIAEMIEDSTPEDRATVKQKLAMLSNKI